MKTEYLYFDVGEETYRFRPDDATLDSTLEADLDGHIARIGINYQFGN